MVVNDNYKCMKKRVAACRLNKRIKLSLKLKFI